MAMNEKLVMERTPQMPEVVHVYDAVAGRYYDTTCHVTTAPTPAVLPGAPMPFTNLKDAK